MLARNLTQTKSVTYSHGTPHCVRKVKTNLEFKPDNIGYDLQIYEIINARLRVVYMKTMICESSNSFKSQD